jgi:hypothetical protein
LSDQILFTGIGAMEEMDNEFSFDLRLKPLHSVKVMETGL